MNSPTPRPAVVSIILRGGLIAGTLDALDAVIAYGFLGMNPVQVLQCVASGLLGTAAFAGNTVIGFANAGLWRGAALLHRPGRRSDLLHGQPENSRAESEARPVRAALRDVGISFHELPCAAPVGRREEPFSWGLFLNGIIGHALFVGGPIALLAAGPRRRAQHNIVTIAA